MLVIAKCNSSYEDVDLLVRYLSPRLSFRQNIENSSLIFAINFCIRELLNNAVEHGNALDRGREVELILHYVGKDIYILVKDEGHGFCLDRELTRAGKLDIKGVRTRGLKTLKMLGFELDFTEGWIRAKITIEGNEKSHGYTGDER
ncbi:MAG: ATP-binding protein [Clostridiales bacterium]|nr:ATP-binding protein [Clostridiales bacterium]